MGRSLSTRTRDSRHQLPVRLPAAFYPPLAVLGCRGQTEDQPSVIFVASQGLPRAFPGPSLGHHGLPSFPRFSRVPRTPRDRRDSCPKRECESGVGGIRDAVRPPPCILSPPRVAPVEDPTWSPSGGRTSRVSFVENRDGVPRAPGYHHQHHLNQNHLDPGPRKGRGVQRGAQEGKTKP